ALDALLAGHDRVCRQGFYICNCLQLAESLVFHRRLLLIEVPSPQKLSRADALTRAGKAALPN
ncbi:hypothetical protein, partial [Mesorhizobium sp. M7A.F.Ca.US.007.01.1.1]|uniref:hypothetical protein n=1 Tax=Mesorhizobium sp. M7A.F.Ca.US.007.01.1.1 TaxID=2496712 RepID=UPI0019D26E32